MQGGSPMSSGTARQVVQSFAGPAAGPSDRAGLSPREQSVLELLTQAFLHKEISDALGVSVPTVNTYIRRVYERLPVYSRSQAVAKYLKPVP